MASFESEFVHESTDSSSKSNKRSEEEGDEKECDNSTFFTITFAIVTRVTCALVILDLGANCRQLSP